MAWTTQPTRYTLVGRDGPATREELEDALQEAALAGDHGQVRMAVDRLLGADMVDLAVVVEGGYCSMNLEHRSFGEIAIDVDLRQARQAQATAC